MRQLITLHVNGEDLELAVPAHWTLLEALRYEAGLTGSKQGCDKGDCGACTVLVDGEPVLACCTLALTEQGKAIETVEGLGDEDGPSVVQRAFDVCGALQCGFCQPGMILSATALLRRDPDPSDDAIREALSGNLCRCTGYTKIFDAVRLAARGLDRRPPVVYGDELTGPTRRSGVPVPDLEVIGKRSRKTDAIGKATGAAQYTDDLVLPRMAHGRVKRATHAHARIVSIDTSAAEAMDGVYAVVLGEELPTPYCVIPWTPDETALAVGKVRHAGEGVAAVAARDEETAIAACNAIVVEYEPLPCVLTPAEALAEDAPLVHEHDWKGRERTDNVCKEVALTFGDVDGAVEQAAAVVEGHWSYTGSNHAAIEPHCAVADWDADGRLTVWSATQVTHYLHRELAKVLDVPAQRIRVIQPPLGGAFGGKSEPFDLEFCAAALARKAGRPVKILYTREEVFYAHRGRHPMEFDFKVAADAQGRILAVEDDVVLDGGAYHSFGLVTTYYAGQLLCGPLRFGTYRYRSRRVYTNKAACGPKRGHGSVQPRFPLETAIDEVAQKLGIDPIAIRRVNAMEGGETTVVGQYVPSCGVKECLDAVEAASGWRERYADLPEGVGLGVATSQYISGTAYPVYPNEMPQSAVQLRADRSGKITIFAGTNDIGQGSDSMLAYIVSEETGVPVDDIRVISADTDLTPVDLGAYSSRLTLMAGSAALEAARRLRELMVSALAEKWDVPSERVVIRQGEAFDREDPGTAVGTVEALQIAEARHGLLGTTGNFRTIPLGGEYRGGTIGASPAYSATAHVAEVFVDKQTGIVEVRRLWAAHDCGRAINPVLVEGQIEGSVYMGLSEALFEDMAYHHEGKQRGLQVGPNLLDYRIATSVDVPAIQAAIVETIDPVGPYGAKEAGEGPLHPAIPAVANAIWRATGARLHTMPFTPERVLRALQEREARLAAS